MQALSHSARGVRQLAAASVLRHACSQRQTCGAFGAGSSRGRRILVTTGQSVPSARHAARSSLARANAAHVTGPCLTFCKRSVVSAHKKATIELFSRTPAEVTVQPRAHEVAVDPDDAYASLAPEDLGEHALRSATQSGWPADDSDAYSLGAAPAAAAPRFRSTDELSSDDVWAETIQLAEEYGAWVEAKGGDSAFEWDDPLESTWSRDVDLSQAKIVEASLFDAGSEETVNERRAPRVHADNASIEHTRTGKRSRRLRAVK